MIRAARALLRWDQRQLAEASSVSLATVKRLEARQRSDNLLARARVGGRGNWVYKWRPARSEVGRLDLTNVIPADIELMPTEAGPAFGFAKTSRAN